jgi:predicted DNA-binding transcriptional regulator YafY
MLPSLFWVGKNVRARGEPAFKIAVPIIVGIPRWFDEERMNKTARLFTLLDALRGHRRPVTAAHLAEELSVSMRTIYRDMQDLIAMGAPVEGEAGMGYVLRTGFFLPPLMFAEDEIEALVLGAKWVQKQGDDALAQAAAAALAKIATATPADLRDKMADAGLLIFTDSSQVETALATIRLSIRRECKLVLAYKDEHGASTERIVWPFALAFMENKRLLAAWCELRGGFRHFRTDRIVSATADDTRYPRRRHDLVKAWRLEQNIPLDC